MTSDLIPDNQLVQPLLTGNKIFYFYTIMQFMYILADISLLLTMLTDTIFLSIF